MTIDDESSVYVGGLPCTATEDSIRRVFDLYGAVVAVKIVSDRATRGKCYGFVTFTNPRSAIDAINDMNGRTIDGQVVKVSEVTTRGGKSNISRDRFRRNDWDKGRDQERNDDRYRGRFRDQYSARSRERTPSHDRDKDRIGGYEHVRDHDASRERVSNRDRDRNLEENEQGHRRSIDQDSEKRFELDRKRDREIDGTNGYFRSVDEDKDYSSRKHDGSTINNQHTRELSSNSSIDYSDEVKEQLDKSIQRREELEQEISQMEVRLVEKQQHVLDLQKRSKKLEDALINAKKLSSHRQKQLTKLFKCFMEVKEYTERVKICDQELQSIVDAVMIESDVGEELA
ncbi:hypothetical protein ACOSQ2_015708 [Xanthoceras sorbifolium]|uniref:RRM domain-containing protein n=1 Tax=Xanthoceras sorbifolium TaxID=99658 RepID=A0ABQ8I6T0_9ROSI|nr:hypothetical protein JRO89_XS04G0240700 [Xanthoceras sorbifolium]